MVDQRSSIEEATQDQRLLRLYRYWDERRGGRPFPAPTDMDPADYAYAVEMVSIIDVRRDPLRFHYRLVSTQLTEHLGYAMTGKDVDEIPEPSMRQFTRAFYERALERQAPLHETGTVLIRREEWWHETLVLPLASDCNNIKVLLIYRNTVSPVPVTRPPAIKALPDD